ncbi:MAG: hypothetical protein ACJ8EY_00530 [Sphingomicrobium sp.]
MADLENGVRILGGPERDARMFWANHLPDYRDSLMVAIADTSEALSSTRLSPRLRAEFGRQLPELRAYLDMVNRQLAGRRGQPEGLE